MTAKISRFLDVEKYKKSFENNLNEGKSWKNFRFQFPVDNFF